MDEYLSLIQFLKVGFNQNKNGQTDAQNEKSVIQLPVQKTGRCSG
ncbi:hypothetical protein CKAH01_09054 [Colletotrichum kahawae]|uniref:Uncharacterized protein n=1 Tax=Colletotrichum kahawae TaxID=34407 RepID=A0AAD9XZH7_COLKA|nr:hypothetical protein CKAH01_09054 [Colletotrichum kahawae]